MRDAEVSFAWNRVRSAREADTANRNVPVIDLGNIYPATIERGAMSPESGRLTGETLAAAIAMQQKTDLNTFAAQSMNTKKLKGNSD